MGIKPIQKENKLRIHKSNVMSVLLYGAECWKVNQNDGQRLNTFHNRCYVYSGQEQFQMKNCMKR